MPCPEGPRMPLSKGTACRAPTEGDGAIGEDLSRSVAPASVPVISQAKSTGSARQGRRAYGFSAMRPLNKVKTFDNHYS